MLSKIIVIIEIMVTAKKLLCPTEEEGVVGGVKVLGVVDKVVDDVLEAVVVEATVVCVPVGPVVVVVVVAVVEVDVGVSEVVGVEVEVVGGEVKSGVSVVLLLEMISVK